MSLEMMDILNGGSFEILLRIVVSLILGILIGLEREIINKSAGLRTQTLVCLGSTIFTLLSLYGFQPHVNPDGSFVPADPARIAAQIVTGVGFIGGGVVLKSGGTIHGITTAASLWMAAAVGMAVGCGNFFVAAFAALLSILVLISLGHFEKKYLFKLQRRFARLQINIHTTSEFTVATQNYITEKFYDLLEMDVVKAKKGKDLVQVNFIVDVFSNNPTSTVYSKLKELEGYQTINVKQLLNIEH